MNNAEAVLSVKFRSALSTERLTKVSEQDLEAFRNVPGLIQKYYVVEDLTGAINGFYIFENKKARAAFWASELAKTIPARYGMVPDSLRVEQYEMLIVLNDTLIN